MTNSCGACGRPGTKSWQRYASPDELRAAAGDPNVPSVAPGDTEALIMVLACGEHAFPLVMDDQGVERPSNLSAVVHDADCPAPDHIAVPCCSAAG